ncbi:2319_t:CDS:1, partial [Racocetra persica]
NQDNSNMENLKKQSTSNSNIENLKKQSMSNSQLNTAEIMIQESGTQNLNINIEKDCTNKGAHSSDDSDGSVSLVQPLTQ